MGPTGLIFSGGGIHGLFQVIGDVLRPIKRKLYPHFGINMDSISYKIGQALTTFILVDFAWIFFRAESVKVAFGYIRNMVTRWNPWVISNESLYNIGLSHYEWNVLLLALIVLFLVDLIRIVKGERIDGFLKRQGTFTKGIFIIFLILLIAIYGQYGGGFDEKQFIYFQF